jgi:hypothetical protein
MDMDKDGLTRRCPRLGGEISFSYCRTCGQDRQPCWKVFDCWWETFDIVSHMKTCLDAEQFERLTKIRPEPKINSLLDLITQAKAGKV